MVVVFLIIWKPETLPVVALNKIGIFMLRIITGIVFIACMSVHAQAWSQKGESLAKDLGRALALDSICAGFVMSAANMRKVIDSEGFDFTDFSAAQGEYFDSVQDQLRETVFGVDSGAHDATRVCSAGWLLFGEGGTERAGFLVRAVD